MTSTDSTAATCKNKIASDPLQSVGIAIAAGFVLTRLPLIGILGLALRVSLALVRPALLILGGVKAWDLIQARRPDISQATPENRY